MYRGGIAAGRLLRGGLLLGDQRDRAGDGAGAVAGLAGQGTPRDGGQLGVCLVQVIVEDDVIVQALLLDAAA